MSRMKKLCFAAIALFGASVGGLAIAQTVRPFVLNLTGGEYIQIEPPNTAQIAYTSVNALRDGRDYVYNVPVSGFTLTMSQLQSAVSLNPAGTLAAGTVVMPATKLDGRIVSVYSTQTITAFTLSGANGATVTSAPTTLASGPAGRITYVYSAAANTWYPI